MRPEDTQMASGRATEPDITIPEEALEAAAIELHRSIWGDDCFSWAEIGSETRNHFRRHARAACFAMLKNWPGIRTPTAQWASDNAQKIAPCIIFPLPTEKPAHE